ncbi:putative oxidoreductase [Lasiosphaeria hispida]|uniref:Oxidoreductase n=1 Tax=Lasiosphaeria hispida TaxID=260671 RepID=A0AAJ0MAM1_9PEZI|nr:putative oxidoreductase [Lasiosphaeria hispida]
MLSTLTTSGFADTPATSASTTFTSIPVVDLSQAESPASKATFLAQLRYALVVVGFFYLKNTSMPKNVRDNFVQKSIQLSELPLEKKLKIDMVNSKHFLGYSQMGREKTARITDCREMFDFLTPLPAPGPEDPVYLNVQGPNQWPDEEDVPGFREAVETYLEEVGKLGDTMKVLVAEALDLPANAFARFFNTPARNKVSVLKYPVPSPAKPCSVANDEGYFQGVGAHKDGGFLTFLLQATEHAGLEAQNKLGDWIPVPPIADTYVVNVGRSLEALTGAVCTATTHRVNLHPQYFFDANKRSLGPRYSYPVFQTLKLDLTHEDLTSLRLPAHIQDLVKDDKIKSDAEAFFCRFHLQSPGQGIFTARLTSHPNVGRRWYPELTEQILKAQKEFNEGS